MKTTTMHHPTLPSTREVPDSAVKSWQDAGWLKSKPKAVREAEQADN